MMDFGGLRAGTQAVGENGIVAGVDRERERLLRTLGGREKSASGPFWQLRSTVHSTAPIMTNCQSP